MCQALYQEVVSKRHPCLPRKRETETERYLARGGGPEKAGIPEGANTKMSRGVWCILGTALDQQVPGTE